jgi:hypothetical protein
MKAQKALSAQVKMLAGVNQQTGMRIDTTVIIRASEPQGLF